MDEPSFDYQQVGELFVMQYYTQMHKDPSQMYKFYQDSSTFVHGGPKMGKGELIRGKKAIHERIMSLDLQQVHTKIRQVDSHASIPNAIGPSVVIQVTGELSVARETMRPFVQTFVLVKETHRNYFVFNDIFRYQLYDEDLVENVSEPQELNQADNEQPNTVIERPLSKEIHSPSIPDEISYEQSLPSAAMDLPQHGDNRSPVPPTGNTPGHSDAIIHEGMTTHWSSDQYGEPQSNGLPEEAHMTMGEDPSYSLDPIEDENTTPNDTNIEDIKEDPHQSSGETKPGTWASRITKNISGGKQGGGNSYYTQPLPSKSTQQQPSTQQPSQQQPLPQRDPKPIKKQPPQTQPLDRSQEKKPFINSAPPLTTRSAPDSHQVFVGGLPVNTTENELKGVFAHFGHIVEVRVNPKNFGFIVFDNEESVHEVMSSKDVSPLTLRDKRLNIEEKRQSNPKGYFSGGSGSGSFGGRGKGPLRPVNRPQRRN